METANTEQFSLYKLWITVWSRLPFIIMCAVIAAIIFLGFVLCTPEKYPVNASVKVNRIEGIKNFGLEELCYFLKNDGLLEQFADENHDINAIKRNLSVTVNQKTGYIEFKVNKTKDPVFWFNVINSSVVKINNIAHEKYHNLAEIELNKLNNDINKIKETSFNQEDKTIYNELIIQKSSLENQLDNFEDALSFVNTPRIGEKVSKGKGTMIVLGTIIGGIIGIICSLIIDFNNKKVELSNDLNFLSNKDNLIITIPEYKNPIDFDARHCIYINSLMKEKDENILVTSLSNNVGVNTIVKGLKLANKNNDKTIISKGSLKNNPSLFESLNNIDRIVIVLRKNVDNTTEIKTLQNSLDYLGFHSITYVLNFASRNDANAIKYLPDNKYKGSRFRFI